MRRALRVLLIAPHPFLEWRGSPLRVARTAATLAELGHGVDLLTLPVGAPAELPGVRVLRVGNPLRIRRVPIGPSWRKLSFDALLFLRAAALSGRQAYDVFHCVEESAAIGWALARPRGARLLCERHSDPASHSGGALRDAALALYAPVEAFLLARADGVVCTGERVYAATARLRPGKPTYLVADPPATAVEATTEEAARAGASLRARPAEALLVYAGSFADYQGIDLVFGGFANAVTNGADARLVLVGGSPADRARWIPWLAERGLGERVDWRGAVPPDELPPLLAAADVLLCPRRAGLNPPLKLIELLKAGRPIVASDVPPNRATVDEGCALLVPHDEGAWGAALRRVLVEPDLGRRLGAAARDRFEQRYALPHFRAALARVYDELAGGAAAAARPGNGDR